MEPQQAISTIETDLRTLVKLVLTESEWQDALGSDKMEALRNRLTEEQKRRKPAIVPIGLLSYTHFYELRIILNKNWQKVNPALGDKKDFEVWADQIEDFRNAPAHSRELLPFERSMLEGLAGMVRTRVTMFRSQLAPDRTYYPIIESVSDSFGSLYEPPATTGGLYASVNTGLVVRPGDTVRFHARGWDPQGRELHWDLRPDGVSVRVRAIGMEVDLDWVVLDSDVGVNAFVELNLRSDGKYHRHRVHDDRVSFRYQVDPPEEAE